MLGAILQSNGSILGAALLLKAAGLSRHWAHSLGSGMLGDQRQTPLYQTAAPWRLTSRLPLKGGGVVCWLAEGRG